MYYGLAFICGCSIVLSIIFNGKVASEVGAKQASLINFITGLALITGIYLLFDRGSLFPKSQLSPYLYIGGALGVGVVILSSQVINKLSALYVTILAFLGQMFTAMVIDYIQSGVLDKANILGSIVMLVGLILNVYFDGEQNKDLNEEENVESQIALREKVIDGEVA